jgi:HEAT repeat protein
MADKVELLVNILLDKTAREDERDDAAMYLGEYPDTRALDALIQVASDPSEDFSIVDNCAVSIGDIYMKLNTFDENSFKKMTPFAQKIVFSSIMEEKPGLIDQKLKDEFLK